MMEQFRNIVESDLPRITLAVGSKDDSTVFLSLFYKQAFP
jgi:hypothetical protein